MSLNPFLFKKRSSSLCLKNENKRRLTSAVWFLLYLKVRGVFYSVSTPESGTILCWLIQESVGAEITEPDWCWVFLVLMRLEPRSSLLSTCRNTSTHQLMFRSYQQSVMMDAAPVSENDNKTLVQYQGQRLTSSFEPKWSGSAPKRVLPGKTECLWETDGDHTPQTRRKAVTGVCDVAFPPGKLNGHCSASSAHEKLVYSPATPAEDGWQ